MGGYSASMRPAGPEVRMLPSGCPMRRRELSTYRNGRRSHRLMQEAEDCPARNRMWLSSDAHHYPRVGPAHGPDLLVVLRGSVLSTPPTSRGARLVSNGRALSLRARRRRRQPTSRVGVGGGLMEDQLTMPRKSRGVRLFCLDRQRVVADIYGLMAEELLCLLG